MNLRITEKTILEDLIRKQYPYIKIGSPGTSLSLGDYYTQWNNYLERIKSHEEEALNHIRRVRGYSR